jgi:hypothetical protein
MRIYRLDIGWAVTANQRRHLHWELLACEEICGVFPTARPEVLAVLFSGDRLHFRELVASLATAPPTTTTEGAF